MNKSKIFMIVGICMLCISVIGSTIAYYYQEIFSVDTSTITYGLDYYIEYAKGEDINVEGLTPVSNYSEGNSSDIELWKIDDTYDIYGHIYIDIEELGDKLSNSFALTYTLVNNGTVIAEGGIQNNTNNRILVKENISLQTAKDLYTLYVWLNEEYTDSSLSSEYVSLSVSCEATMKPITVSSPGTNAIQYITNLYNNGNPMSRSVGPMTGTYLYSTSAQLVNDGVDSTGTAVTTGNLRYVCINETNCNTINNYIYFNCDNYSDTTTCETWRILGVIDGRVKIMRSGVIGDYSYDYTSTGEYDSNWSDATLMTMLNDGYYHNKDGVEYYNQSTTPTIVNFKSDGIGITPATRQYQLIADSTWYYNTVTSSVMSTYAFSTLYTAERSGTNTWDGKIALLSPSEYAISYWIEYSTTIFNETSAFWLLNPASTKDSTAIVSSSALAQIAQSRRTAGIVPVLYLNEDVRILVGDGSSTYPYQIGI